MYFCPTGRQAARFLLFIFSADCGLPPAVRNTVVTYSSIKINSTVTYTCQATYTYITGTTTARCQDDGTWTKASVICTGTVSRVTHQLICRTVGEKNHFILTFTIQLVNNV